MYELLNKYLEEAKLEGEIEGFIEGLLLYDIEAKQKLAEYKK